MTYHIRQPRVNHVPHTTRLGPPIGATSSTDGLRIAGVAEPSPKAFLTSALDGDQGTTSRSSSIISGWKAPVPNKQDSLT